MSRAHTRSSSRMSSLSRASNVSTATSSSRLNTLLDDFDMRASTPIKLHTTNLLVPKREDPEYETLRKTIFRSRYRSRADSAAVLIQKTFRMHQVKKRIIATLQSHKKRRNRRMQLFFNIILLNSFNLKFDRRKVFDDAVSSATFLRKFYRGYSPSTNEIYAATGMMTTPPFIDGQSLIRFVYSFYRSRLRSMLEEWHVVTCKSRRHAKLSKKFKLDQMSVLRCGIFYKAFAMWLNYTRSKRNRRLATISLPEWDFFMKGRLRKQRHVENATDFRKKTICENAVLALRNVVLRHRHFKRFYEQSIEYNIKKSMKFALSAWIKYLIIQQNKSVTMRFVFRRWLQSVQRRKHLIMLSNALTRRHQYYQKRLIVDILAKNKKVSQCLNMYQYLRIMQKPSLALYFVSILRKDKYSEAIAHTFTAWIDLVRRRRRWLHFAFMNEVTSEYTPKKRLFLAALRHYALPSLTPICLYSDRFKKESMYMYQNVMNEKIDPSSIYLIVNGETPDEVKKAASKTKTRIQQREVFFEIWKSQKNKDFSLFMRSAVVYCAKKASITMRDTENIPDLCYKQYKKVINFLGGMNIASDQKFQAALRTVKENNKKNLMNRMSCLHRDNLIILAHDSHSDAVDLHDENIAFKNSDDFVKTKKIIEASESLAKNFQPLIPISNLGAILEQPNEDQFVFVDGCKSHFKSFKPTIIECHNVIQRELVRSEIGHDVASRFDKLLSGHDLSSSAKNGAHSHSRVDSYIRYKGDNPPPKSRPSTGINDKLSSKFPQRNRKARIIGKETEKFSMSELPPIELNEEEQNHEEEDKNEGKSGTDIYKDDIGTFERKKSITNVFSNNEKTLLNSLMSRSQEKLEKFEKSEKVADHAEEEEDRLMEAITKMRNEDEKEDSDGAFEIDQTLANGFDKSTMMSLKQVKDIKPPKPAKKYKLFLEILFGRAGKDINNVQINRFRQKIISEYKNKKLSLAACGINTKNISRPVSGILEEYRRKDDLSEKSSPRENDNENDKEKNNKDKQQINPNEEKEEYCQIYNSRRYKFKKKVHDSNEDLESPSKSKNETSRYDEDDEDDESKDKNLNSENGGNDNNNNDNYGNDNDNENANNNDKGNKDNENNDQDNENNNSNNTNSIDNNNKNDNNSFSSDESEFRENLDDDDGREKKSFFETDNEDIDENGIRKDEQIEDTEFDPAAKEKVENEGEEEEEGENGEEIVSNKGENGEGQTKNDIKVSPSRRSKRSSRRISTATPYTSMNKNEGSPINKIDKVAIGLLTNQIPDEKGFGLLVDVDPEQIPPLRIQNSEGNSQSENNEPTVYLPGYKNRRRIKVTSKLNKRTVPIVIPNKKEMTPNMKLAYYESENFDKLLLVNGKSQYVHAKKKESPIKYVPVYNKVVLNNSMELGNIDRSNFVEDQVVSFQGGRRQLGTQSPNFINVRIQQGKQRSMMKPFNNLADGILNISKTLNEQHSLSSIGAPYAKISSTSSSSLSTNHSSSSLQLNSRAITSHIKDLTNKIVTNLAMSQDDDETFGSFWQHAKDTQKKMKNHSSNSNLIMADIGHKIYDELTEINFDYNKNNNFIYTVNCLLGLASQHNVYSPILVDAIEKARKLIKQPKSGNEKTKNKPKSDLKLTSNNIETNWMSDLPLDYNYNAVALQYREDKGGGDDENNNLEAIIASTKPSKTNSKRRPKTQLLPEKKWDDVLQDYNISDMILVTPYIIPENVVDDFLNEYEKQLNDQK